MSGDRWFTEVISNPQMSGSLGEPEKYCGMRVGTILAYIHLYNSLDHARLLEI